VLQPGERFHEGLQLAQSVAAYGLTELVGSGEIP